MPPPNGRDTGARRSYGGRYERSRQVARLMLTRPDPLTNEVLTEVLGAGWDISPAAIRYLAVGYGSHHWQVTTASRGRRWFVTVDDLAGRLRSPADTAAAACGRLRSALEAARALADAGASFVVAPVTTGDGGIVRRIGDRYAMAVYPFAAGRARQFGDALSPADRRAVLPLITAVHGAPASVRRRARADDFVLPGGDALRCGLDELTVGWDGGPHGERARRLLARLAGPLERLLRHRDQLAEQARSRPDRVVVTHGEPHPGNLIQAASGWLLVDWDTTLLAPPERDLWLLDPGDGSVIDAYRQATGREISPPVLDLYRLTWELSDVASSVARFRRVHGDTAEDRADWESLSRGCSGRSNMST